VYPYAKKHAASRVFPATARLSCIGLFNVLV